MKISIVFFLLLFLEVNTSLIGEDTIVAQVPAEIPAVIRSDPKQEKVTADTFFSALQAQDLDSLATKAANTNLKELIDETRKSATGKFRSEQSAPEQQTPKKDYLSLLGQQDLAQLAQLSKENGIPDLREISDPKSVDWQDIADKITKIRDKKDESSVRVKCILPPLPTNLRVMDFQTANKQASFIKLNQIPIIGRLLAGGNEKKKWFPLSDKTKAWIWLIIFVLISIVMI